MKSQLFKIAKFEVCGHKWSNLSEYNNGIALLNDCKYGYSTHDNIMGLSLLRSPKAPDDTCDMGNHSFNYSILPHNNDIELVIKEAYNFNTSLTLIQGKEIKDTEEDLIEFDSKSIIIESIKKAEKSNSIIIRLYESLGGHFKTQIKFQKSIKKVSICNNLERKDKYLIFDFNHHLVLKFSPFQIISLKLEL